jgi:hypothetical protein
VPHIGITSIDSSSVNIFYLITYSNVLIRADSFGKVNVVWNL